MVNFMLTSKIDKMGRTVIPSLIRKVLDLKEGDYVEWLIDEGRVVIRKKIQVDKTIIKRRFEELRKKAPECFVGGKEVEDKWALKEWALVKLGL